MVFRCLLPWIISREKSAVTIIFIPMFVIYFSPLLASFKIFNLLVLSNLAMMCLNAVFFIFLIIRICYTSWIYEFLVFIKIRKFSASIYLIIFLFPFPFGYPNCIYIRVPEIAPLIIDFLVHVVIICCWISFPITAHLILVEFSSQSAAFWSHNPTEVVFTSFLILWKDPLKDLWTFHFKSCYPVLLYLKSWVGFLIHPANLYILIIMFK